METMKELTVNINGLGDMVVFRTTRALNGDVSAGVEIAVTSGEDGELYFTDLAAERVVFQTVITDGPIPSLAVTPEQTHILLVLEEENALYSYTMPPTRESMDKLLFRSTVAIRQVVCSSKFIALADEEAKVKVLLRASPDKLIAIDGHEGAIKSVTIDPSEQYVCTASDDGTVRVFALLERSLSATQVAVFRVQHHDIKEEDVLLRCAWQPGDKGDLIAVPVNQSTIELYGQIMWRSRGQLLLPVGKSTSSDINVIAFSPNGQYVAAATLAKQVFIWSIETKAVVRSFKLDYTVLSVQWAEAANTLAVYHTGGKLGLVNSVIPIGLTPPHGTAIAPVTADTTIRPTPKPSSAAASSFIEDEAAESHEEDETEARVEAIKASFGFGQAVDASETIDDEVSSSQAIQTIAGGSSASGGFASPFKTTIEPFHSGTVQDGTVHLLAWTPMGEIECIRGANLSENLIKVEFVDKSRRGFKFSDNYMFSMAFLDDHGALFGVPRRVREDWEVEEGGDTGDLRRSFIFYRPFESWASNSSWHIDLPESEDAECVACAAEFCAVATSLHCVRIYTTSGLDYALVRLPGRIVTMTAKRSLLALVYQDVYGKLAFQLLRVRVHSKHERLQLLSKGNLPLTPPPVDVFASHKEQSEAREDVSQWSTLSWLGFDDRNVLYTVDSLGVVQALASSMGWNWFPIGCVGNSLDKKPADRHGIFALGIVNDSLLYFLLDQGRQAPKVRGKHRPVPLSFGLQQATFPTTAGSSKKADARVNTMWQNARLHALETELHELDEDAARQGDHMIVSEQAAMDKALILMMKTACTNDEPMRVLDLAKCLNLEKSHQIAQKLAMHYGLRQLQSQLYELYRVRFEEPEVSQQDVFAPSSSSYSSAPIQSTAAPLSDDRSPLERAKSVALGRKPRAVVESEHEVDTKAPQSEEDDAGTNHHHPVVERRPQPPAAAPVVVKRSVAPTNPFLKKTSAGDSVGTGDAKKKTGLDRLAKFASPPPAAKKARRFGNK